MKALSIVVIAFLLASCGPSAEQITATADMARAQTQTAAPTLTPTLMPTPTLTSTPTFTSTPDFTPTPISSESIVTISHSAPEEKPPRGLPPKATSKYFTSSGGFQVQVGGNDKPWTASFNLLLTIEENIPNGARIEIHFENPLDPTTAIVTQMDGPFSESILVTSSALKGIQCKIYWVEVHIYSDSSKTNELGSHLQWLQSNFNTDKMTDITDLFSDASCKR